MDNHIEIYSNRSLRLDNVLVNSIIEASTIQSEQYYDNDCSLGLEVERMATEMRIRGASPIGPLIQFSNPNGELSDYHIRISLMMQADRFINNISDPYKMVPVIQAKNCMFTHFIGKEEDIHFAYKKIQVVAYEEGIKLKGSSYTIFLDSDDNGNITADIFMEREEEK